MALGWTAPCGIGCAKVLVVTDQTMEPSEMEIKQIGIDTSKHVFTVHGVDVSGDAVMRRDLRRSAFEA